MNKDKTDKSLFKKGNKNIENSVDNELKLISIIFNKNN